MMRTLEKPMARAEVTNSKAFRWYVRPGRRACRWQPVTPRTMTSCGSWVHHRHGGQGQEHEGEAIITFTAL